MSEVHGSGTSPVDSQVDAPFAVRRSPFAPDSPSVVVVQTAFLGDVVLTTPLLDALATEFGPVDVVTTPGAAALLETHPAVHRVIRHDKHGTARGLRGVMELAAAIRAGGYTRAYLPHQSWRSGLATMLAGVPERIGFADAPARLSYTRRVVRPVKQHETVRLLALAGGLGPAQPTLGLTPADHGAAIAWLETHGVTAPFVALAPGSIWGTKRWGKYPALAAGLTQDVVVIGGPEDAALADAIVATAPQARSAVGMLTLRGSAALLSRAAALVTNDSLPLHLAQATGTPTVAIFGPTVPAFGYGPQGGRDRVVELHGLECRPCSLHGPMRCPLGHHRCMVDLEVMHVAEALHATLTE
jgi:heptosyltransferase-2